MSQMKIQLDLEEIAALRDGLQILDPDTDEGADIRGDLEIRMDKRLENADDSELSVTNEEMEIMTSSVEILSPDSLEGEEMREALEAKLRLVYDMGIDLPSP